MTESNTTYIIKGVYDLEGAVISCPEGSILKFKKGALIQNGTIQGNRTTIKAKKNIRSFLQDVTLKGHFENNESYLSWWITKDDITKEVNSLLSSFNGLIYLDRNGVLSDIVCAKVKENVVIDGCQKTFIFHNYPTIGFRASFCNSIEIRNINIEFSGVCTNDYNPVIQCFRVEHCDSSKVSIHDISIKGFCNVNDTPCSFLGINVMYCNEGTETDIFNVTITDIAVKGDEIEVIGVGGNYGIGVSCNIKESGVVSIHDCRMYRMSNINSKGNSIYEDTSGIYLAGKYNEEGTLKDCHWHAKVYNCFFQDISKRNIKVQGDYVIISNLNSRCTEAFLQDYKNMYIGAEGNYLTIKNIRGQYDGSIVKISGDYLFADNIKCSSNLRDSDYSRVFTLDGCLHAYINDCSFDNETYMFIYPTEKNYSENVSPFFSFSNCDLHLKHILYCVSNQQHIFEQGVLEVNNCTIFLSSTICFNGKALKEAIFNNCVVKYKSSLSIPKNNSSSIRVLNNNSLIERAL